MGPQGKKGKPKAAKASSKRGTPSSPASPAAAKPKVQKKKVMRALAKKEPQLVENTKRALIMKGNHTSQIILDVLTDVSKLLKPNCRVMGRKNDIYPFEDANALEFLTSKNDCSLFAIGSHSKKRPHNLILGRTYDGHMLDMVEFGVEAHVALETVKGPKKAVGYA
jgi:ribosome production factor 2